MISGREINIYMPIVTKCRDSMTCGRALIKERLFIRTISSSKRSVSFKGKIMCFVTEFRALNIAWKMMKTNTRMDSLIRTKLRTGLSTKGT